MMHPPLNRRNFTPVISSIVAESPGVTLDQLAARTSLFRSEVADALRDLGAAGKIERRDGRFYVRQKERVSGASAKRQKTWREQLAWVLFGV
jgi:DNA-binding IclR family transcriptional regulator